MSDYYDFDLVCIGSGPAGQRAAVQAAKLGKRAAVVEKRRAGRRLHRHRYHPEQGASRGGDDLVETGVARYREIARGQILGDHGGMFKRLFHREDRRLLGIHCIGTGATELVHVDQAVLGLGGRLDYFLHTVFNDPTLAECYKVAALDASNKLRF